MSELKTLKDFEIEGRMDGFQMLRRCRG